MTHLTLLPNDMESPHGGQLESGNSLTQSIKLIVPALVKQPELAQFVSDFQTVWFVVNVRNAVIIMHT